MAAIGTTLPANPLRPSTEGVASSTGAARSGHPNLLFIMTDQHRYDALGVNGNPVISTPSLNALAGAGVNFHGFYTNTPVCVPSRCCLFTGRYPHSHRVRENHNLLEYGREIHLFRVLKQAGYAIGYSGKNHLLEEEEMANFDFHGEDTERDDQVMRTWYAAERKKLSDGGKPELWRAGMFHDFPDENTRTGKTAAAGLRFLRDRDKARPFCLCVSFADPHVEHLAPRRFEKLYPLEKLQPYPHAEGELKSRPRRYEIKRRAQKADTADDAGQRHYMAVYYAMISYVDEKVGMLLAELDRQGIADNTIVVFTADHGEFCFEHGMYKKDLVLSDSLLHVPCLIRYPGMVRACALRHTMAEQVDIMPTVLDLMGVKTPFGVQGKSLAPCLAGVRTSHKDAVFAEICPPWLRNPFATYDEREKSHGAWAATPYNVIGDYNKSIRERDFRYVWFGTGEEELYDHTTDPHEQKNLAADPAYASQKARLKLRLLEWVALSEDPLDPLSIRELQARYGNWTGAAVLPGSTSGPVWLNQRFAPSGL
jgi:arylsulfatase A-like enzyme